MAERKTTSRRKAANTVTVSRRGRRKVQPIEQANNTQAEFPEVDDTPTEELFANAHPKLVEAIQFYQGELDHHRGEIANRERQVSVMAEQVAFLRNHVGAVLSRYLGFKVEQQQMTLDQASHHHSVEMQQVDGTLMSLATNQAGEQPNG